MSGVAALVLVLATTTSARADGLGAPLTEPTEALERALQCDRTLAGADRAPVILVHGTGSTPEESFSFGYVPALAKLGVAVCTVRLPERGLVDMQRSIQYVVYAIREVARRSGRQVSLVGYSQGAALAVYAPYFWPDLAAKVDDVIGLAGPYRGSTTADDSCADGRCPVFAWQFRTGSSLNRAYASKPQPPGVSFTAIATTIDEFVAPAPSAARLDGASNVVVQDLCPARPVDHFLLVGDAVTYAVALDALAHPGPADRARLHPITCLQTIIPGADLLRTAAIAPLAIANVLVAQTNAPLVEREPQLRCPFHAADCAPPLLRLTRRCIRGGHLRMTLEGDADAVRLVTFKLGSRVVGRDLTEPFTVTVARRSLRRAGSGRARAIVSLKDPAAARRVLARSNPRCR